MRTINDRAGGEWYVCTKCGSDLQKSNGGYTTPVSDWNFCPWCGESL